MPFEIKYLAFLGSTGFAVKTTSGLYFIVFNNFESVFKLKFVSNNNL